MSFIFNLPIELIESILKSLVGKRQFLNTCKTYYKHRRLLMNDLKYIIYNIYSDHHGYPEYKVLSICDTLEICKNNIKTYLLKCPISYPAYETMTKHNLYTTFDRNQINFCNYSGSVRSATCGSVRYATCGRGFLIEEMILNEIIDVPY